jgi:hypothetical protein
MSELQAPPGGAPKAYEASRDLDCRGVSPESTALVLCCAECGAAWLPADYEHWSAYLTDDEPQELAFFCPTCAERESK